MSEAEKKRRLNYKQNRKKWLTIQLVAIALVAVIALSMFAVFNQLNKTYYIEYTDSGKANYTVKLKDNEFFPGNEVGSNKGYISELIDGIAADFTYQMQMSSGSVQYEYERSVDAVMKITNNKTGAVIYEYTDKLLAGETPVSGKGTLSLSEKVNIDYQKYNDIAEKFISTYSLSSVSANLYVMLDVKVVGNCDELENSTKTDYKTTITIPLCEQLIDITTKTSSPAGEVKVLACRQMTDPGIFKVLGIIFAVLTVVLGGVLVAFIYLTRNDDINYEIRVKRVLNSYRSYIQVVTNGFDFAGYQIIKISSFVEMLGIRDTIQSPVLMLENEDKTCTKFIIPTNTKVLYDFEIKVDNYDELYAQPTEEEPAGKDEMFEEDVVIIEKDVDEEALYEAMAEPDVELDKIDYIPEAVEAVEEGAETVEVIGVVWPEKTKKNKIYKYDPNGEVVAEGDVVLVPSRDVHSKKDVIRKAAVAQGNHFEDSQKLHSPLKKIIGVVKSSLKVYLEK